MGDLAVSEVWRLGRVVVCGECETRRRLSKGWYRYNGRVEEKLVSLEALVWSMAAQTRSRC